MSDFQVNDWEDGSKLGDFDTFKEAEDFVYEDGVKATIYNFVKGGTTLVDGTMPFRKGQNVRVEVYGGTILGTVERCEVYKSAAGTDEWWVIFTPNDFVGNISRVFRAGLTTHVNWRQVRAA